MQLSMLSRSVGLEVSGLDLTGDLSNQEIQTLRKGLQDSGLLVIRNQKLDPENLLKFSHHLGEIAAYTRSKFSLEEYPEVLVLSNVTSNGKPKGSAVSGRVWHVDGHYLDHIPSATILSMQILQTEGGNTSFANMQKAYEALPRNIIDKIQDLELVVSRTQSREYNYPERGPATPAEIEEWKNVVHPIVLRHPQNDRNGLGVGGNVPWSIEGLDQEEALPLMTFLQEWTVQRQFIYEHVWKAGDVIVWDNYVVMHKASPYSGDRLLHRTTVYRDGEGPETVIAAQ